MAWRRLKPGCPIVLARQEKSCLARFLWCARGLGGERLLRSRKRQPKAMVSVRGGICRKPDFETLYYKQKLAQAGYFDFPALYEQL